MDFPIILVRFGELMLVEQQTGKAVGVAQFELGVHFDRLERADFDADLAAHANGDIDVENIRIELRFADVIRFLVLALLDVNALRRTFLLANLAGDTAQARVRVIAVENQERKIARRFLGGQTLFGVLDRDQAFLVNITADKITRRFRQTFNNAFAEHKNLASMFDVQCSMFDVSESTRNLMTEHRTSNIERRTLNPSSVHLTQHNVHAAENHHDVGYDVAEAHVFQNGQIDQARRTHAIAIRIRPAVADDVETQLAFRRFDTAISFARLRTKEIGRAHV